VTNLKGEKYNPFEPGIIATNGKIHDELQKIIAGDKW
jgi:myo-inositol-1(or 4)-monophosphatase